MPNTLRKIKNILETNRPAGFLFDKIAGLSAYRRFINYKIRKYTRRIRENKAYNVIIETTNICNAGCVMCPHKKMERKKEVMRDETFGLIIEKLKNEKINPLAFILNGFGDPLTDQKIFDRVKTIKEEFPGAIVKFYSNLGLADDKAIENILNSGLNEINISFNGYDRTSYEKTMKIDYQKTLNNLENLIAEKNKSRSKLKIRISMALVSHNAGDEKKFLKFWRGKVNSVSVNKIHTYNNSVEDFSGKNKINFRKPVYPCKYLWNTIVFGTSGDIYLCCLDYAGKYNFGNISENGILDIFYSGEFDAIREKHLKNDVKSIDICSTCYTPYKNGAEWLVDNLY